MNKVYLVSAKRSAIGSMLGSLKTVAPADLGAEVVKAVLAETKINPADIDEVIMGNILMAGWAQGIARQVSINAGIPQEVPAYGVNMICGSGMKAVLNAYMAIKAGSENLVIAGGTENMSAAPMLVPGKVRTGTKMGNLTMVDHMINDSLTDAFTGVHMGITAENIAAKYGITREMQDAFSAKSQEKAIKAVDAGLFKEEIVPIHVKEGKKEFDFDTDEYPNRSTNFEKLGTLRPAFKKDGTVTAGNASGINDGASVCLIASEDAVKKYNLKPMAEIIGVGQGGVDPQYMGLGPVPAIRMALKNAGVKLSDLEVMELNEAFAAQSLGVVKLLSEEHGISEEAIKAKTNPRGGAIALGHPVGASGNRILVTLAHEMVQENKHLGIASLCIGGGMGTAVVLKR